MSSYNEDKPSLLTQTGFIADLVGKFKSWKKARKDWETIWKDCEERWLLHTKGKDQDWMTDTPPTETNIAVEGAFSEIKDILFGANTKEYFKVKKFGTDTKLPIQKELLQLRLDKQIKLRKIFAGDYGLRQLLIKGTMIGMVNWKREGGYTLQYNPQPNGDYVAEKIYKEDNVDRPDVKLLPLDDVVLEPGAPFEEAEKMYIESITYDEAKRRYHMNLEDLKASDYPGTKEEEKEERRQDLNLPDGEVRRNRSMCEILHVYKYCKPSYIQKILENNTTMDMENPEQESDYNDEREGMDEEAVVDNEMDKFYHIVIGNQSVLLEAEEPVAAIYPDPFFKATYIPVDGEHYGFGIPYLVKGPQDQLKDILDLSLDNIKLRLYTMIKYKPVSSVDKFVLKIRPMGLIPDRSGNDVSVFEIPDATSPSIQRESSLSFKIQEASHVNKIISGSAQQLPNKTATGASIMKQQSSKAFKTIVEWIGENTIVPILERVYALDRQFTPPSVVFSLLGDKAAIEWSQIPPDQLFQEAEFEFIQAVDLVSNDFKATVLRDLLNIGGKFPWFNAPEAMRKLAVAVTEDPDGLIFDPQMMQQMGAPAPAPGLGGGISNSPLGPGNQGQGAPEQFQNPGANGTQNIGG